MSTNYEEDMNMDTSKEVSKELKNESTENRSSNFVISSGIKLPMDCSIRMKV